ncbi:MAG: HD domain-containing protein [Candidatus Zixiibacteriota bacterium]
MKSIFVRDLKVGNRIEDFFVLRKKELKEYNGQKFLKLELGDKSGRVDAVLWEQAEKFYAQAEVGDIIQIRGSTTTYKDSLQITLESLKKTDEKVKLSDFLPSSEKDIEELFLRFKDMASSVKKPYLKALLESLIDDSALMQNLKQAPGGKLWHHSYLGGLLEHTLMVAQICEKAASLYELIDRDLLITGALIHDIGKIKQYSTSGFIDYSDEGRLIGHIVSGYDLITRKIEKIKDFPEELALKLRHLILSHQGQLEMASPVVPQTLEAIILHYADEMDAKSGAFTHIIKREKLKDKKWSDWVPLIKRFIYLGEEDK